MEEGRANEQTNNAAALVVQSEEDNDVNMKSWTVEGKGTAYSKESKSYTEPYPTAALTIHKGWQETGPSPGSPIYLEAAGGIRQAAAHGCLS